MHWDYKTGRHYGKKKINKICQDSIEDIFNNIHDFNKSFLVVIVVSKRIEQQSQFEKK